MRTKRFAVALLMAMAFVSLALFSPLGTKAHAADEITIGVIGPMKFVYGEHMAKCAEMAADKINAAGGIKIKGKSYKVVLRVADDNCFLSVPDAVNAMERLVTHDKIKYVIGGFRTEAVLAQQDTMADNKIIFLGTGSAHDEQCLRVGKDYNRYKYWFRVSPTATSEQSIQYIMIAAKAVDAVKKLGIKKPKVAILADKAVWTEPMVARAEDVFPKLGCEVVGIWRPGFNASTLSAELSAIKSSGAHIIYCMLAGATGNVLNRQWGELQIPAVITGVVNEASRETHWKATDGKCNYVTTAAGILPITNLTRQTQPFIAEFQKRFATNITPISTGYGTYDAIFILKEAMEKSNSLDPDVLVPVIEKTDYLGIPGKYSFTPPGSKAPHEVTWGPNIQTPIAIQWRDGKIQLVWPDGKEINPILIANGAPKGWDKMKLQGVKDYELPQWAVEYWKGRK